MTILQDSFGSYIQITPIKVNFITNVIATRVYVSSVFDDLYSHAVFAVRFADDAGFELYAVQTTMSGDSYSSWNGDNVTPFNYVVNTLGLTTI